MCIFKFRGGFIRNARYSIRRIRGFQSRSFASTSRKGTPWSGINTPSIPAQVPLLSSHPTCSTLRVPSWSSSFQPFSLSLQIKPRDGYTSLPASGRQVSIIILWSTVLAMRQALFIAARRVFAVSLWWVGTSFRGVQKLNKAIVVRT